MPLYNDHGSPNRCDKGQNELEGCLDFLGAKIQNSKIKYFLFSSQHEEHVLYLLHIFGGLKILIMKTAHS